MSVHVTRRAQKDLNEIWDYIARDNPGAADKVLDQVYAALATLDASPRVGHERADVNAPGLRFWCVYSYVVAYRIRGRKVSVTRVVHGARDFRRVFRSRK